MKPITQIAKSAYQNCINASFSRQMLILAGALAIFIGGMTWLIHENPKDFISVSCSGKEVSIGNKHKIKAIEIMLTLKLTNGETEAHLKTVGPHSNIHFQTNGEDYLWGLLSTKHNITSFEINSMKFSKKKTENEERAYSSDSYQFEGENDVSSWWTGESTVEDDNGYRPDNGYETYRRQQEEEEERQRQYQDDQREAEEHRRQAEWDRSYYTPDNISAERHENQASALDH